MKEIRKIRIGE